MQHEGITVVGIGRVSVTPDVLVARFGAEVTASSVQAALDQCSATLKQMLDVLKEAGVESRDRQTAGARVFQAFDSQGAPRGWTSSQQLTARIRDTAMSGDLVGATLGAGGDAARLHDLSFVVNDPAEAQMQARDLAYADALAKAQRFSELSARRLGMVEAIWENDTSSGGSPSPRMMSFAASPPVEAGESEISAAVGVRWGLLS